MKNDDFDRRQFVKIGTAGLALWSLGCGTDPNDPSSTGRTSIDPKVGGGDPTLPVTCGDLTESNIEGPFFTPSSPERTSLLEAGMAGVVLQLAGRVVDTDCAPVPGALLDFWQANDDGDYDNIGYTLRGHQRVNAEGQWQLTTIIPGRYLNGATYRPAHIHVKVFRQQLPMLTTQLYFHDDPFNDTDPWIRDSLTMRAEPGVYDPTVRHGTFNFVLPTA